MRTLAANLGFTLQLAGAFLLPAIGAGLYYKELSPVVFLFCAATAFLFLGFLLNSLAEKRQLGIGQSALLITITFSLLSAIGAVPYFFSVFSEGPLLERAANSLFESVSGYTTTGFSFVKDEALLPISLQIYRATTEIVGGIGLVFLLLAFLYPKGSMNGLESALGTEEIESFSPRRKYFEIFSVYAIYIIALAVTLYVTGYKDAFRNFIHIIHLMTGGYSSSPGVLGPYLDGAGLVIAALTMFIGAVSFIFHHRLVTRKLTTILGAEAIVFLGIVLAGGALLSGASGGIWRGIFNSLSFSSNTGISTVSFASYKEIDKLVLIALMFIGGCGFSMAGGVKVSRIISAVRGVGEMATRYLTGAVPGESESLETRQGRERTAERLASLTAIAFGGLVVFSSAILLMGAFGGGFVDSLFESVSAYSTTGGTLGLVSEALPAWAKFLFSVLMLLGRIDLIILVLALGYVAMSASSKRQETYRVEIEKGEN